MPIKKVNPIKLSHQFISILALVSILGFMGIVGRTLFNFDPGFYVEALWMIVIGVGLVLEGQITRIKEIRLEGLTPTNFTHLTTIVIGIIAIISGIFSFPILRVDNQGFLAVKGIISVIAIVMIVIQTWIVD